MSELGIVLRQNLSIGPFVGLIIASCLFPLPAGAEPLKASRHLEPNSAMDPSEAKSDLLMNMSNPGSIEDRVAEDAEPTDYLFQFPGVSEALAPWYDLKNQLAERHGFTFGVSYTAYYQRASSVFGPEDDAASFDLDVSGTWTFLGRHTDSPTMLGFDLFWRDKLSTEIPPQLLFTQYGSLYSGAAPFGIEDPVLGELWIQQKFGNTLGIRAGKIFPITAYDFFPFKNFRTAFVDFNHVTNATIPLPGNGLGAFLQYRPHPKVMLRLGVHDANADVQKSGFDTLNGELFTIFEAGFDTGQTARQTGRPPGSHFHISLWRQDERKDAGIDSGWGVGISAVQRFGRYAPFARYGYADVTASGPTPARHMVNAGVVVDEIFGQDKDSIGIGFTWTDPADRSLKKQSAIDAFYRVQLTPEIEVGSTMELIFNPVRNPAQDTVFVWGLRSRFEF